MAIPSNVSRVVLTGTLPQGEQFATGFWLANFAADNQTEAQAAAAVIGSYFEQYALTQMAGLIASDSAFTDLTVYGYSAGGPTADTVGQASITGGTGTGAGASLPLQLAWVATLNSGLPGRSRRGRMYWPVNALALTAHQMTQAQIDASVQAVGDWLEAVLDNGAYGQPAIVSQVGAGSLVAVLSVDGDSRLDVQRRRASSQTELYQASESIV